MGSAKQSIKFTWLHYGERGQWRKGKYRSGFLPLPELQRLFYTFSFIVSQTQIGLLRDGSVASANPSL